MNDKELAKIISKAESEKWETLDLSKNGLLEIPVGIGKLFSVKRLHLNNNQLSSLPEEIGKLSNLEELNINDNKLAVLPSTLFQLSKLKILRMNGNKLFTVPKKISNFTKLKVLNVSANNINALPLEVYSLSFLQELYASDNQITAIAKKIGDLKELNVLDFSFNRLFSLPREINLLKDLISLNLNNNRFSMIPQGVYLLQSIRNLSLANNDLRELQPDISNLTSMVSLDLSGNQLENLTEGLFSLKNLRKLNISINSLEILPSQIGNLENLEELSFGYNKISELPAEIGNLIDLSSLISERYYSPYESQHIYKNCNRLTFLPQEIGKLKKLQKIIIGGNTLQELPKEIDKLVNLREIRLGGNKLSSIPMNIQNLPHLEILDLRNNLLSIPPEILDNFHEPKAILNYYYSILGNKKRRLNQLKLLVVGQGSVGKTSLVQQIIHGMFDQNQNKTEGISINEWLLGSDENIKFDVKTKITIWDFGGQEIMHATHQFFLTKRSLYLLVLDSRLTQEENRVEYWLKIIQSFGGESPVLIIGNKIDQHPLDIDRTGLQKKYPNIVGILETSAATGAGIEELKAAITEQVNNLPHVRDLLPETWFTVKTKLEALGRESNFITHDKYLELCAENEVSDETSQRTLIGFLHDLGVVLHFQDDPRLEALGILNPQWVTNGVYKILNSHNLFQNKGVLTTSMLDEILNLPEYPRGKRLFIVDMMKKFELCYDIEADKNFLVPDLLPKDEPAELKFNGVPAFEYAYPVLPSSVITRFIVRMNQKIDDGFAWRTGVVLKIGENKALVIADIEDRKITIAIDGLEHTRRDALSAIRYQLDEIHGSIKGLDAQKRVPIPNAPDAEPLKYEYLLMLEQAGQETHLVQDGNRLIPINVRQTLSAIENESQRKERGGNVTNIYISGDVKGGTIIAGDDNEVKK
jgi:small GTP-binding protein